MNYPRIWLIPSSWGLGESATELLAFPMIGLYFLAVFAAVGKVSWSEALVLGTVLCSPTAMLAVERCNNDILIFALLIFGLLISRAKAGMKVMSYLTVLIAAILKLYPIFALLILAKERRCKRALAWLFLITLPFLIYLYHTRRDLALISKAVPRPLTDSFGCQILLSAINDRILDNALGPLAIGLISLGVACALAVTTLIFARRNSVRIHRVAPWDTFLVGTGIYLGTFLFSNSWNYRLIFLLMTIPFILRLASESSRMRLLTMTLIGAIVWCFVGASVCALFRVRFVVGFALHQLASWFVYWGLAALVFCTTLPPNFEARAAKSGNGHLLW